MVFYRDWWGFMIGKVWNFSIVLKVFNFKMGGQDKVLNGLDIQKLTSWRYVRSCFCMCLPQVVQQK